MLAVAAASGGNEPGAPPALRLRSAAAVELESREDPVLTVLRVAPGAVATLRARLAADGVRVLAYLPDDALLVERAGLDASTLADVVASEPWRAELAITPELASIDRTRAKLYPGGVPIVVGLARAADLAGLADRLGGLGARVSWNAPTAAVPQLGLLADPDRLPAVLNALKVTAGLTWADLQPPVRLLNGDVVWRCQSGIEGATPLFDRGLHGQGQIVGIMDTGIDIDHCAFRDDVVGLPALNGDHGTEVDPDHRKVLAVDFYWSQDWPDPGPLDWDDHGHGSHVAGSVAGDGGADGVHGGADGMAPASRLVIQDGGYSVDDCADLPGLGCPLAEPVPSRDQGWGIIQLDRVLLFEGAESRLQVDDEWDGFAASLDPPLRRELSVGVDGPLKVVLVWTDPPSTSLAAVNLVNDLDLVVEGPDGTLLGNHFVEGASQPGGSADRLNNVEVVWLAQASPGEWTVEVRPHAIREAGQGFALVVLSSPPAVAPRRPRGRLVPVP